MTEKVQADGLRRHFKDSDDLCRYMVDTFGDTVFVHFSMGKDSLCTLLQCLRFWKRVVPVFMYIIPDLRFIEQQLAYYEDFFQIPILRYPRESFIWYVTEPEYSPPWRIIPTYDMDVPVNHSSWTVEPDLRARFNCPNAWTGQGIRAFDSLTRRTAFRRTGPLHPGHRFFYPIYDWKTERMVQELRSARPAPGASEHTHQWSTQGLRLPIDYRYANRSFDSPRERFLAFIERVFPDDYERIKFWLPLVECERYRHRFGRVAYGDDTEEQDNGNQAGR